MKRMMFDCQGSHGETHFVLFNEEDTDTSPWVVSWKFFECGASFLIVSIVDTFGEHLQSECVTVNKEGYYSAVFMIRTDWGDKYILDVAYYEELHKVVVDVVVDE